MSGQPRSVENKSGEVTKHVEVIQVAIGGVPKSRVASIKHGLEPNASDIINEYLDTLGKGDSPFIQMHFDSLYDLYKTYRTSNSNADRSSTAALERLKSFINSKLRRADNINKLL